MKLNYDYTSAYSNNQKMYWEKKADPTLCGFDPMASCPNKEDGSYAFEMVPIRKEELHKMYPNLDMSNISFARSEGDVAFSFTNLSQEKIALLCYMYVKKKKKIKINRLSTGQDVTDEGYEKLKQKWEQNHSIPQLPVIAYSRQSHETIICRYLFVESDVLEYVETPYSGFPLVYVDGDSTIIHNSASSGQITQFTRPSIWPAMDCQRVKNLALQTWSNFVENMINHKFMAPAASIPERYIDAWINPQKASTLIYNHVDEFQNPLPQPSAVPQVAMPTEVMELYQIMDQSVQATLGSFSPMYAEMTKQNISGRAIVESATQDNAAAMPYITNFMIALNRLSQLTIDLCPKIYVTPQLVPIIDVSGKRILQPINIHDDPNSISLKTKPNEIKVEVTAGVNFEMQKNQALQTLQGLAQAFPVVGEFINTVGLPIIIENVSIKGQASLQAAADDFQDKMVKKQQQAQQSAQQAPPPPEVVKNQLLQQKMQLDNQVDQQRNQIDQQKLQLQAAELQLQAKKVNNEHVSNMLETLSAQQDHELEKQKVRAENVKSIAEIAQSKHDSDITVAKHILDHSHKMAQVSQSVQPPQPIDEGSQNETQS